MIEFNNIFEKNSEENWINKIEKGQEFFDLGIVPGVNLAILENGEWKKKSFGVVDHRNIETNEMIYYDIASLTKIFTVLIWLKFLEDNSIDIDQKAKKFIKQFEKFPDISLRDVFSHRSSLHLIERFDANEDHNRSTIARYFEDLNNLKKVKDNDYDYSDAPYILLGRGLEENLEDRLDIIFEKFCNKYGLEGITFLPKKKGITDEQIALSSDSLNIGEVFDHKNRFYGGVNGHSGLFATTKGLMGFCESLLANRFELSRKNNYYYYKPYHLVNEQTKLGFSLGGWRRGFISNKYPNMSGYTGPSITIDPVKKKVMVMNTNLNFPQNTSSKRELYRNFLRNLFE